MFPSSGGGFGEPDWKDGAGAVDSVDSADAIIGKRRRNLAISAEFGLGWRGQEEEEERRGGE
jgi:hypothetical protein